ncbi:MAG: site-specific integrase [Nitrospirae bacterium]|nr:site-specific integrase [Nitrospirota bacterium]
MAKGIYKRGNRYWIRYAGLDGRIVYEPSGSTKFKDAEALLIKRKQAIKEGKQPEIKKIGNHSFKELAETYIAWVNGRQKSAKIKEYIIKQLIPTYGNLPLRRFSTSVVEQLQTDLIKRGLKNCSCNKVLNILKHMFSKAADWDMVESEVLKNVRKVKLLRDDSERLRYLSKEECQALINACDPHLKPIVITALNTGMRRGEILSLRWDNIDLKHGFILLDVTKNGEKRQIPIHDTLRKTLTGITRRIDIQHVFYDPITGKQYKDVKHSFQTACKRAGIRDFHFHDLRHTFASQLVMTGVDITTVGKLLGHKTLAMTLRYSHLAPEHMVKAMDILDNALNGKINSVEDRLFDAKYTKSIQFEVNSL